LEGSAFRLWVVVLSAVTITGCTVTGTPREPVRAPSPNLSSVSIHPGPFSHRMNPGNDGTDYEPCSDVNRPAVQELGWDWSSRRDAAVVDRQTARGCVWKDTRHGSIWSLQQVAGNSPSLVAYKRVNYFFDWLPDQWINGRQIVVFSMNPSTCVARVQSRRAGINTIVDSFEVPAPPIADICSRAIAFTRATISRMPE